MHGLPPGPREPTALQTVEWIVRPTALLRRAQARYGEPFTLRTAWSDAPLVLVSDPAEIKRAYAAPPDVLQAGDSSAFLEPFVGPRSILILNGEAHLRQRKLMLPPFHGDALRSWTTTIAEIANAELDTWVPGRPLKALPRMQALTLEVIQRVIFGSRDPELRDALRAALDLTGSTPRLIAMSLVQREVGPYGRFVRAVRRIDELVYARVDAAMAAAGEIAREVRDGDARGVGDGAPGVGDESAARVGDSAPRERGEVARGGAGGARDASILDALVASGATREELRDQLVTLLAAGHETTATALAWALERLARQPADLGDDAHIDATVKEVLRTRPVLSITARKTLAPYRLGDYTLPAGVYVAPCLYLAHRRAGTGFDPSRFLDGDGPEPYTFVPFGGGTRRCLGAAFATLEMREVLRAVSQRFTLRPDRLQPERMRRRGVTLAPARGGSIVPLTR